MIFAGSSREELRRVFLDAWRKRQAGSVLEPLQGTVADLIAEHPEYLEVFENPQSAGRDFTPEAGQPNPFLHLSMHLAIREQVATDRPPGVREVHRALATASDAHAAEHAMMECLGQALWEAQRSSTAPDELRYLECLRRLVKR